MTTPRLSFLLCLLLWLPALPAQAALKSLVPVSSRPVFVTADEAFRLETDAGKKSLQLQFRILPGYYLYRARFRFEAQGPGLIMGAPVYSGEGEWKDDPAFGHVQVHHEDVTVTLPLRGTGKLRVGWQGCADAGLCYPPQSRTVEFSDGTPVAPPPEPAQGPAQKPLSSPGTIAAPMTKTVVTARLVPAVTPATNPAPVPAAESGSRLAQLLFMFALGLGLAFTPCVLPMLPILAGIIARQHTSSALRGFLLALSYVLGVATVYALMGFAVGFFGQQINLPGLFQQPAVLIGFALLFFVLALSLFGLFELRLPHALQSHFDGLSRRQQGGVLAGSFLIGVFSALVVSPCVSAPLFGVLLHISLTGDATFGALSLFLLAFGMGTPLLVLGATEGRLLPKAGNWMHEVKTLFGILLLFVAAELLTRLLPGPAGLALYGLCTAAAGFWLWRVYPLHNGLGFLLRGLAFTVLTWAAALMVGAASGADDPLRPLTVFSSQTQTKATTFIRVRSSADLEREIAMAKAAGQPVMLDFYADWCVSCKIMERTVFRRADVAQRLSRLRLLQADVTANNADDRALLKRFSLLGPPSIVFINGSGVEMPAARLVGEKDAAQFLAHLDANGL